MPLLAKSRPSIDHALLVLASMGKLRTPEAIETAKLVFETIRKEGQIKGDRFLPLYAWVRYANGEAAVAHDILTSRHNMFTAASTNLMIAVYAELGQVYRPGTILVLIISDRPG